ncbi:MAG: pyruvate:ferredoxin (flavodoxin) oxidoreductase [Phycisphaerae bacterium]|nr:pyruvate:ferredoxin (flavodoxin) oxidoreductase [Phycisphaerae bacterium]
MNVSTNQQAGQRDKATIDGNEAAAYVAHKINEVIAIYPITPSSNMGEHADAWSADGKPNIWGTVPQVVEMQSEGGAAAAVHGALQTGSLTTTFTASQGLLLMIPTMYKIAGELTSTVFHVSARSLACQALSIFGDHSDVMAVRQTGFGLVCSNSPQEVIDFALISTACSLEARIPFIHFFDGFRTSHEVQKIELLTVEDLRAMISDDLVAAHRARGMSPEKPVLRGTSQNPDVYFQGRETVNKYHDACPAIMQKAMDKFAKIVGRQYHLFDYVGAPDATNVVVVMGSGADTAEETVEVLNKKGAKLGLLKVHLYRPFSISHFVGALPKSVQRICVLDRTKEPGSAGEPLYLDVVNALAEAGRSGIKVIGGRYGLSSKEFTPAMVKAVYDNLAAASPKNHFTVGINDDVTHTSLAVDATFSTEPDDVVRAMFYGLGSDGTVGANKNSIKIIGDETDNYAQGYFVYDSKKAGAITVSHLRFGPRPIRSAYLITDANFVACHQFGFLERYDVLAAVRPGSVFLLNTPYTQEETWNKIPRPVQQQIIDKKLKLYVINGYEVAKATGMGGRVNTIMQTCFFALSGVLPREEAIAKIKYAIKKTYGSKGEKIVAMNFAAVDQTLANLHEMKTPAAPTSTLELPPVVPAEAPAFVKDVTAAIIAGRGDDIPVSKMPADGTWPTATTQWEKRNIALEIPAWDPAVCVQCAKCSIICPHASIRAKAYDAAALAGAPATFKSAEAKGGDFKGLKWTIQVAPEDCTGCGACVEACPAKNKTQPGRKAINMEFQPPLRESERANFTFFLNIPEFDRAKLKVNTVKGSQLLRPLFEFSGACAGCGETPYLKLLTQLFGDRMVVGNATGCSSIYGGNLPTTPYAKNADGRGPAWNNSLFEDCAEFSFGFRLTLDKQAEFARELLAKLSAQIGGELVAGLLNADQSAEAGIAEQRKRVAALKAKLATITDADAARLATIADTLVRRSVWAIGGDGWAYDIGYGGLDHVLASGRNINVLVLDTQVYSNTGGQCSKSTPRGAVAKFAAGGKPAPRKDLGAIAMSYGTIFVAQVSLGANDNQTVKAFIEAESYNGPSIVLAYSHCIAHGINMRTAFDQGKKAVESGFWPLYRFDPRLVEQGKNPLQLDSRPPSISLKDYAYNETRYTMLTKSNPAAAATLIDQAQKDVADKWRLLEQMAAMHYGPVAPAPAEAPVAK